MVDRFDESGRFVLAECRVSFCAEAVNGKGERVYQITKMALELGRRGIMRECFYVERAPKTGDATVYRAYAGRP
jgi:hypothetical protein